MRRKANNIGRGAIALSFVAAIWMSLLLGSPAWAQQVATPGETTEGETGTSAGSENVDWSDVEEMVVFGAGNALAILDAPTSAMTFTAEDLAVARVADVRDLAEITPNLEIKTGAGASNATIFIRGIGLNDFNANASSSVAIINDGVHVNSPAGQLFQLFDVESSDVLRGPQGTLLGRNVTAGAIRVFSKKPGDEVAARLSMSYGNYDLVEVEGGLTAPILPELLSVRLAGKFRLRDGVTKNRCAESQNVGNASLGACNRPTLANVSPISTSLPKWVNEVDNWAARAIARLTASETTEFLLNVHVGRSEGDARQNQSRGTRPSSIAGARFGVDAQDYADPDNDPFEGAYDIVSNEYLELFGASLTANLTFEHFDLISISAYEQNDRAFLDNTDAAPSLVLQADIKDKARQWSQDIRLESNSDGRFGWKVGGLFATERVSTDNVFRVTGSGLRLPTRQILRQTFFHGAVFGFASYELSETLTIEGGLRAAWEKKQFEVTAFRFRTVDPSRRIPEVPFQATEQAVWKPVTGDIILTWAPTESIDFYAKYARGWKTGHFNGGAARPDILIDPVDPERVNGFEIGGSGSFFDGALQINAAIYYYDYKDYQVFALQNQPDSLPLPQLLNAQDVESRGFEVELRTTPVEGVRWNAALGWVEAKFGTFTTTIFRQAQSLILCGGVQFCTIPVNNDYTGNTLPAAPAFSFTTNFEFDIPMSRVGTLTPRIDASYKTKVFFDQQGDDALSQAPFWVINSRLTYATLDGSLTLSAWVKNLLDEEYLVQSFDLRQIGESIVDSFGEPRTFGMTVGLNF